MNTIHNIESYYNSQAKESKTEQARWQQRRNVITVLRLLLFALLVWELYGVAALDTRFWIWAALGTVVSFIVLGILDSRVVRRIRYYEELGRCCRTEISAMGGDFGDLPTGDEFADPRHAYSADLDIFGDDSIFRIINRTVTAGGKYLLASWLLTPCQDAEEIRARQAATKELSERPEWALRFRVTGALGRKKSSRKHTTNNEPLNNFLAEPKLFGGRWWRWICYILPALTIGMWAFSMNGIALTLTLLQLVIVGIYLKRISGMQQRLDGLIGMMGSYTELVRMIGEGDGFESGYLKKLQANLTNDQSGALPAFRELIKIQNGLEQRANILAMLVTNALWMRDIHIVMRLERWRERYGIHIGKWLSTVVEMDVLVSMANFRFNSPDYVVPQITDDVMLDVRAAGHPMLTRAGMVTNDFVVNNLHELYIVTGANMAGKSTFLRTIGVGLVMALSGNMVCAMAFRCRPMTLFTSMRTTDNLSKGTSYFHAELLRLQELVQKAEKEEHLFIILDEMLKGTNSQDKLNGSLRFLEKLRSYRIAGLVATHDLALGELQERFADNFRNICFEINHHGDEIVYDYKLHQGVSRNMNASILLEQMGLI